MKTRFELQKALNRPKKERKKNKVAYYMAYLSVNVR